MSHYDLCPKKKHWYRKCQCGLIQKTRDDLIDLIQMQSPQFNETKARWYYSGRQDAAEEVEGLKHNDECFCEPCEVLTNAYKAALGKTK